MVSDIVLTKELPDFIKDSVDAYVGCISGAITREEYLKTIADTGFKEVRVVSETSVPVKEWLNDSIAESVTTKLKISSEQAKEVLGSISSIKVKGIK